MIEVNSCNTKEVTTDDLVKLQVLLKEYTRKLKEICEAKVKNDFKRLQLSAISAMAVALSGVIFAIYFVQIAKASNSMFSFITVSSVAILMITCIAFGSSLFTYRLKYTFDADEVAACLRSLIKLASQYGEHANKKISVKFEYELRLAEAESALKLYLKVFSRRNIDLKSESWSERSSQL